jgi:hypothetical protein
MAKDPDDELRVHVAELRQLRGDGGDLFMGVSAILFRHDPIGVDFATNIDEYDPETRAILPRLHSCKTVTDVQIVLHEEFVRWFAPHLAGPAARYSDAAEEVWVFWQQFRTEPPRF